MPKFLLKTLSISVCLAWASLASAVGVGNINVSSSLGQPLKADIDLVALTKAEKTSLVARLASPDTYKNAGLDYPYNNKFKFEVASHPNGESYLKVTSDQPIQDPFVVMMVELNWAAGRLVREYTFLLDPPGYVADQPAPADVQPVAPVVQAAPDAPVVESAPVIETPAPVETIPAVVEAADEEVLPEPTPAPIVAKAEPAKPAAPISRFDIAPSPAKKTPAKAAPAAVTAAADTYVVQKGDTLARIASDEVASKVSLDRTLIALYRANQDQFVGGNINRLSVGKVLRLPTEKELASVTQAEAVTEIRAQAEDWNAYRQKLAGAATTSSQTKEAKQVATGKINSSVADKAPVAKDSAQEVLKLSKGAAPSDKAAAVSSGKATAQSQKDAVNAAKEEEIAKAKTLKEGQERAAVLAKNLKDAERLAQLKLEAAALTQKNMSPPVAETKPAVAPVVADATMPKPVEKPKADVKKVVKSEPSLLDTVLENPTYLAGGGAGLLGLLGLGWFAARRRKVPAFVDETGGVAASDQGLITDMATIAPTTEESDFEQAAVNAQPQSEESDGDVDPIKEAELFLNFGRDAQAEDILKEALVNTPDNHNIHLKLLGIYANRKDLAQFENLALELKNTGDEEAFKQASEMGRGFDPRNQLYGGDRSLEDADSATIQAPAFSESPKVEPEINKPVEVDFDLDADHGDVAEIASPERHFLDESQKIASVSAHGDGASATNLDELIFDVTGSHPTMQMEKPAVIQVDLPPDAGMEFTLDEPDEDATAKFAMPEVKIPAVDFAGINLNLGDESQTNQVTAEEKSDQWQEVATKIDLAKAYQEMGDDAGSREILEEVLRDGDAGQQAAAQELISKLAA